MKIAIIGGGAAGFFAALSAKEHFPKAEVVILEKTTKLLAKVKVSGGGRCNVTNACDGNKLLSTFYPRGEHFLRKAFEQFNNQDMMRWLEERNVALKIYPDNCVFPRSNDSQSIIDCFLSNVLKTGIEIKTQFNVDKIIRVNELFHISSLNGEYLADRVVITIGGQPKIKGFDVLLNLGVTIVPPVPSLFTFNMPDDPIRELMGNVVENVQVKVEGTKLLGKGPLLVTHWGMSGPAILQLSAWGARILEERNYNFSILVNWLNDEKESPLRIRLKEQKLESANKKISKFSPFPMTNRLWVFLLAKAGVSPELRWNELGAKAENKLINILLNDRYEVKGKTTFKEEFVTAGGVSLMKVDVKTMQSKEVNGLFLAGEALDIDGITGGFNFQAAWTTAYIAGKNCGKNT